jgi:hypothetical protein
MTALLSERSRHQKGINAGEDLRVDSKAKLPDGDDMKRLVESVKRKSASMEILTSQPRKKHRV